MLEILQIGIGEAPKLSKVFHKSVQDYQPVRLRERKGP
jgi:hypothetical protein